MIETDTLDAITNNLMGVLPVFHRRLWRIEYPPSDRDISQPHLAVMGMLEQMGILPISEIGRGLSISKPQMTHIIDKLINLGLAERLPDIEDKRKTNIRLTDKGITVLNSHRSLMRANIRAKLSGLKYEELADLSQALVKLKEINAKLE